MTTPMDDTATVHLRVPRALKAQWVRLSRAQVPPMRLSEWLVRQIERPAHRLAQQPCPRCQSVVLVPDGPEWACAQCGLL